MSGRRGWVAGMLALVVAGLLLAPPAARAQEFEFRPPPSADDPTVPDVMRDLATRTLPVYEERDTDKYLTNVAALQLVAGNYTAAYDSRQELQNRRRSADAARPVDKAVLYDIYAQARAIETRDRLPFAQAFTQAFNEVVPRLNDRDAHAVAGWLATPRSVFRDALQRSFDRLRDRGGITFPEAVDLIWTYLSYDAYRSFSPLVEALESKEKGRRYIVDDDVVIRTAAGARIHAVVVRPASVTAPLPALLEFTIDGTRNDGNASAAHGYVGVTAYTRGVSAGTANGGTRGKGHDRRVDGITPFQHDGEDARAVIEWIARQPWSDGRVGMIGDGYSGFAAWSAAKRLPAALKAIATASPMAPGVDFPMAGNIFRNESYRWSARFAHHAQGEDDDARWRAPERAWYESGKPYRDLERRFGKPDAVVRNWLSHPSFDRYWQNRIPSGKAFAAIDIPVLTISGYYADRQAAALYYFDQHLQHNPDADHTLLIGPYDDRALQEGQATSIRAVPTDAAARVDLRELRYQWLDHVFKDGARPAILKDRVNVQLMGANAWRSAPSLSGITDAWQRFYLNPGPAGERHVLSEPILSGTDFIEQAVDLGDRRDADWSPPSELIGRNLPVRHALAFVSEPLQQPLEFSGRFEGRLDFSMNRQDVDLNVTLYEYLANGNYLQLSDPYEFRASYAADRAHRHLLRAGERQQLAFTGERVASRRLGAGSRVVMVLGVNKRPDRQINYGSGQDVKDESIADSRAPLKIRWFASSYVQLPVRRPTGGR